MFRQRSSSDDSDLPCFKKRKTMEIRSEVFATSDSEISCTLPVKKHMERPARVTSDSEIASPVKRKLEYLHDDLELPIYEKTSQTYSAKEIAEILLESDLLTSRIATSHPVSVQDNLVFVVDLSQLEKPEDIRADDLGSWVCNGKRCNGCEVEDGQVTEVFSGLSIQGGSTYRLVRRYYKHATSTDFRRTIAEIYDPIGD